MVLEGWNQQNKIKITIDHTKIEETLTDFPVLITLSSGSGISNYAATRFFEQMTYESCFDEAFTGDNGDSLDSDLWTVSTDCTHANSYHYIYDNKYRFHIDTSQQCTGWVISKWYLDGDCEVQIDIDNSDDTAVNMVAWGIYLFGINDSGVIGIRRHNYTTGRQFVSDEDTVWGWFGFDATASITSTKFRITKVGSAFSLSYWNGTNWVNEQANYSYTGFGSGSPVKVRFYLYKESTFPAMTYDLDNFSVNFGTVIWPHKTHPYRKKIAVTQSDRETQCYTEVETWDELNQKVSIWTKVPTISATEDTVLYLYYDKTQDDNTSYVGDPGDAVAQNVWDSDFAGVWHMCQSPNGDVASVIKDSTISGSHGTPDGTMIGEDLVAGQIGEAIDFDGTDDEIIIGDYSHHNLQQDQQYVLEAIVKMDAVPANSHGLITKIPVGGTYPGYDIYIQNDGKIACHLISEWPDDAWKVKTAATDLIYDSQFHHCAVRYDGSTSASGVDVYVDGFKETLEIEKDVLSSPIPYNHDLIFGRRDGHTEFLDGVIDEVRVSSAWRSTAWIKATNYTSFDNLLTLEDETFTFYGYVKVEGQPASRKVNLYNRNTGELVGSTTSTGTTGYFEIDSYYSEYHYVVVLPELLDDYNLLGDDKIHPTN